MKKRLVPTPGTWTIEKHEGEYAPGFDIRVPMGQYIVTLQDHFAGHGLANARLIAAAPTLADSLEELLTYFDRERAEGVAFDAETMAKINAAETALALARFAK